MRAFVEQLRDVFLIVLGILSATLGLKGFLIPNHFIDGGATGISMLLSELFEVPLALLIPLINLPFMFIGYKQLSRLFTLKSTLAVALLSVSIHFLEIPLVTEDALLAAVFGGFFLGAGIGLSIRGGSVLDGTEVMAIISSKRLHISIGDVILIMNIFIFGMAAIFLDLEKAMYSVLTYLAASKTIDFLIHGIEEYTGVIIISEKSDEMKDMLINDLGRGVTVYKGTGGYSGEEQDILFCVMTRLEIPKVRSQMYQIDENAFVIMHSINDTAGGMIKKRRYH